MDLSSLQFVCNQAIDENRYVSLSHNGVIRDVYPYEIAKGCLYCWCSLHPWREVEAMKIDNIWGAKVSSQRSDPDEFSSYPTLFGTLNDDTEFSESPE